MIGQLEIAITIISVIAIGLSIFALVKSRTDHFSQNIEDEYDLVGINPYGNRNAIPMYGVSF